MKQNDLVNHPLFRKDRLQEEEYHKELGRLKANDAHKEQQETFKKHERYMKLYKKNLSLRNETIYKSDRS